MPRRWMNRYVQMVKGIPYEYIEVLSYFALDRLLRRSPFQRRQILLPSIPPEEVKTLSPFERWQVSVYDIVRKTPIGRAFLYLFGPFFHALCFADKSTTDRSEAQSKSR
jgi:hypothetical protein